ncbi:MAG: tetratricopeptide repeat protein, partial [Chloroflexi bacterium]|nr:tetratricopeptide repeat protein [Chloroflexota bacterium]
MYANAWPGQSSRRPKWMLLISLAILAAAISGGIIRQWTAGAAPAAPAPVELPSETMIAQLQDRIRNRPDDPYLYAQLGLALLQRVRETGDASLYSQAEMAFNEALQRDPRQVDALVGQGILALARHDFAGALRWGEQARALNPYRAQILGIIVDAQVELGRYEEAVASAQAMIDLRPDLTSYSRVSYLRELHGDPAGAIAAMQTAVNSGLPTAEATLWTRVQLGHLYFNSGNLAKAEETYRHTLFFDPDYAYAQAGLARVAAAHGHY